MAVPRGQMLSLDNHLTRTARESNRNHVSTPGLPDTPCCLQRWHIGHIMIELVQNTCRKERCMESQQRLHMITILNEEADQKRLALTHALGAQERIQQGPVSTHGAPLTQDEQALKYERDL
jgi:hypothetical protein